MNRLRPYAPEIAILLASMLFGVLVFFANDCRAEDAPKEPDPFRLKCPTALRCGTADGYWVPHTYMGQLAGDTARLDGCVKQAATYQGEIEANQRALKLQTTRIGVLEDQLVLRDQNMNALSRARDDDRRLIEQRTRWAVVSTVLAVVLAGALGVGFYALQH